MRAALGFCLIGLLTIIMAIIAGGLKRLPLTAAILYIAIGILAGPIAIGYIQLEPWENAELLKHLTETAVIISLFSAGLKLRLPLTAKQWRVPFLLASCAMVVTIALMSVVGVYLFGMSLGGAILLAAILAPTDPVLASSVQVMGPGDSDKLRFSLTAEAGLNDGTAFPFIMLGLGVLGLRDLGTFGWRWLLIDVVWGVAGGIAVGALLATGVAKLVIYLRKKHRKTESLDDLLVFGLISLSYGIAMLLHTGAFLAVFAAGLSLRREERKESQDTVSAFSTQPPREEAASAHMVHGILRFNEQLERIAEIVIVLILGAMLSRKYFSPEHLWLIPILLLVVRPLSVFFGVRTKERTHTGLLSWFGIRGIGSLYYLMFVITQGIPKGLADQLISATFTVIAASIVVHGLSATPLMKRYSGLPKRKTISRMRHI